MGFQKVLIAIDNSANSSEAAEAGFELAKKMNAEVALVYGIDIFLNLNDQDAIMNDTIRSVEIQKIQKEEAKNTIEEIVENYAKGKTIQHFTPEGDPKKEILSTAENWSADVIVIGTHGRTGLSHLIMGSVAEYVVRHSKVPVLVIPLKKN
jgi:nucleotide-binding universal stress UspA family protein